MKIKIEIEVGQDEIVYAIQKLIDYDENINKTNIKRAMVQNLHAVGNNARMCLSEVSNEAYEIGWKIYPEFW